MPNGGNVIILFFGIEWRQHENLEKNSLMDLQCDLNPYANSNGFFICTNYPIIWEDLSEQSSLSLEKNWGSYKYIVLEIESIIDLIVWMVLYKFPHIWIYWGLLTALFFLYSDDRWCFIEADHLVLFMECNLFDE